MDSLPWTPYLLGVGVRLALFALCKLCRWSVAWHWLSHMIYAESRLSTEWGQGSLRGGPAIRVEVTLPPAATPPTCAPTSCHPKPSLLLQQPLGPEVLVPPLESLVLTTWPGTVKNLSTSAGEAEMWV